MFSGWKKGQGDHCQDEEEEEDEDQHSMDGRVEEDWCQVVHGAWAGRGFRFALSGRQRTEENWTADIMSQPKKKLEKCMQTRWQREAAGEQEESEAPALNANTAAQSHTRACTLRAATDWREAGRNAVIFFAILAFYSNLHTSNPHTYTFVSSVFKSQVQQRSELQRWKATEPHDLAGRKWTFPDYLQPWLQIRRRWVWLQLRNVFGSILLMSTAVSCPAARRGDRWVIDCKDNKREKMQLNCFRSLVHSLRFPCQNKICH